MTWRIGLFALSAVTGCQAITGVSDYRQVGGGGGSLATCGANDFCLPTVPGWEGPVLLADPGVPLDTCNGEQGEVFSDAEPVPPASPCFCQCTTPPAEEVCHKIDVGFYGKSPDCSALNKVVPAEAERCTPSGALPTGGANLKWSPTPIFQAPCVPEPMSPIDREAPVGRSVCFPQLSTCGDGVCGSPVAGARWCVVREEEGASCPDDVYTEVERLHGDYADSRDCSFCRCGTTPAACSGDVGLHGALGCVGVAEPLGPDECRPAPGVGGQFSLFYTPALVGAQCMDGDSSPMGEFELTKPLTLCCMPDP